MRGKLSAAPAYRAGHGITPAGAGKTCWLSSLLSVIRDHPRRCGENYRDACKSINAGGSPPQVRGKLIVPIEDERGVRITPAGAGKTEGSRTGLSADRDHPRRCGENSPAKLKAMQGQGSPPQVRGKLRVGGLTDCDRRITPAGAGKTGSTPAVTSACRDHPRRCGENLEILFP